MGELLYSKEVELPGDREGRLHRPGQVKWPKVSGHFSLPFGPADVYARGPSLNKRNPTRCRAASTGLGGGQVPPFRVA